MSEPVDWDVVARRLSAARNYWLVTVGAAGAPHAVPVWGAVHATALYLYTTRSTEKARNLERDNRGLVHLESGEEVVIVHGKLVDLGRPQEHSEVLDALGAKYSHPDDAGYLPQADPAYDVLYRLEPVRALLWSLGSYDDSQQRWSAQDRAKS